ncbi:MAG: hypothetical protein KDC61_03475, partial [Saprospiraceae bacterium]|nr:hypothetical protein [Saprospiraceae bacterium]
MTKKEALIALARLYPHYSNQPKDSEPVFSEIIKLKWVNLSDFEKQERRRAYLNRAIAERKPINYVYYQSLIEIVDFIIKLVKSHEDILLEERFDANLLRILAFMLIEKENIDETIIPNNHLNVTWFSNLADEFRKEYPELSLDNFVRLYDRMYSMWHKKPNVPFFDIMQNSMLIVMINELKDRDWTDPEEKIDENSSFVGAPFKHQWRQYDHEKKQRRRWGRLHYVNNRIVPKGLHAEYYEKLINVSDTIATILKKLNWEYFEKEEVASISTPILKICVILLEEKENIDEDIMPFHHLPPSYFHELAEKYHD